MIFMKKTASLKILTFIIITHMTIVYYFQMLQNIPIISKNNLNSRCMYTGINTS